MIALGGSEAQVRGILDVIPIIRCAKQHILPSPLPSSPTAQSGSLCVLSPMNRHHRTEEPCAVDAALRASQCSMVAESSQFLLGSAPILFLKPRSHLPSVPPPTPLRSEGQARRSTRITITREHPSLPPTLASVNALYARQLLSFVMVPVLLLGTSPPPSANKQTNSSKNQPMRARESRQTASSGET